MNVILKYLPIVLHTVLTGYYQGLIKSRGKNNYFGQLAKRPNTLKFGWPYGIWLAMKNYMTHFQLELVTILTTMS